MVREREREREKERKMETERRTGERKTQGKEERKRGKKSEQERTSGREKIKVGALLGVKIKECLNSTDSVHWSVTEGRESSSEQSSITSHSNTTLPA